MSDWSDCERVPKLSGADVELGNFVLGLDRSGGTGAKASRALLREIEGLPLATPHPYGFEATAHAPARRDPQDWGRKFLPSNGGCAYVDLDHLEICTPEVLSAFDHVAAWHAMLRVARAALERANSRLPAGQTIQVLVNNSDGRSHSYGSHCNFLIARRCWNEIFESRLQHLLFLAACQASSIVLTGQGKVGAENGAPRVDFQLAQRADFFEVLAGPQTTERRPLVNSRDESLAGSAAFGRSGLARLHCIFFDSTLCQVATLLRVGIMQIVLAMIEAGRVNLRLLLEDPLASVRRWSHDPSLKERAALLGGGAVTAVELQLLFLEEAERFVSDGGADGVVPRAPEILAYWGDTLAALAAGDFDRLAGRIDWVLKRALLERAMRQHPRLGWQSAEIRMLDQVYSNLDPAQGLYWACEAEGAVERVVSEERIAHFVREPPEDTRAWARAMLLRGREPERIVAVDWDSITYREGGWAHGAPLYRVDLCDPLGFTREDLLERRYTS
jgi:hypothetical protein